MNKSNLYSWAASGVLSLLIFLSPFLSLSVWSGYTFANLGLLVFALLVMAFKLVDKNENSPIHHEWNSVKKIAASVWLFCGVGLSIDVYFGNPVGSLELYIPFLLMPIAFWAFKHIDASPEWLWAGAAIGSLLGGVTAYHQIAVHEAFRANGYHASAISFGNTGILFACASLIGFYYPGRFNGQIKWKILMGLGFFSGLLVSMLSGSKGGWLSLLTLLIIAFVYQTKKYSLAKKLTVALVMLASLLVLLNLPGNPVKTRVQHAYTGLTHWLETGRDSEADGSVGSRLSMWSFGLSVIDEKPLIGFGQSGLERRWQQDISEGKADPRWGPKGSMHNEILTVYLWRGLLGLVTMLAVYALAFVFFWKHRHHANTQVQGLAVMGMLFVTLYLEFGLSDVIWFVNANRQIFVFWLVALVGLLYRQLLKSEHQPNHQRSQA